MTMGIRSVPTKKVLRTLIGQDARDYIYETSMFGPEYRETGSNLVVGPNAYTDRKWFATIVTIDSIIVKVS